MIVQKRARTETTPASDLERYDRTPAVDVASVERAGGPKRSGAIYGVSVITSGEAAGHEQWIDRTFLSQVADAINATNKGIKARFTHPGMSQDGLGRHLGRVENAYVDGDRVRGDLFFAESAHKTPEGDLAEYVMDLVEEDYEAAGLSIVFEHDREAEYEFRDSRGGVNFESPDADNENNYPHVRLGKLRAADVVDEPAANPDGMYDRQTEPRDAFAFLDYLTGVSSETPAALFGLDPVRAQAFLSRYLAERELHLSSEDTTMTTATTSDAPAIEEPTREDFQAELDRYCEQFGAELGTELFRSQVSFEDGLRKQVEQLQEENSEHAKQILELEEKLSQVSLGEETPVDVAPEPEQFEKKKSPFRFAGSSDE